MKTILSVSLVLLLGSLAHAADCSKEDSYPLITKTELKQVVEKKEAFIVDVNSADSFKKAHVPGAILFGDHQKDFASLLPTSKTAMIVAYCGGVKCDAWKKAAQQACEHGYTNVRHFKEGITGWTAKN
ncbi:MAG: rhodanese-like domain-containing protein [Bdellovibrionota bacterium]